MDNHDHYIQGLYQLAQILKGRRKELELTQAEVARRRGLLPKTVSLIENNPDGVSLESLFKLLSALDLELHLTEKGNPMPFDGQEW